MARKLPARYVAYEDFLAAARKVLPRAVLTYLECGIGNETGLRRNRCDLDAVVLTPRINGDPNKADPGIALFGRDWRYPFGIAPVGLPGVICPGSEHTLMQAARDIGIPYTLGTVASASIEDIAAISSRHMWFQLYAPGLKEIWTDLLARAARAGCEVLLVTVDLPTPQRRERAMRSGVHVPMRLGPLIRQAPFHPRWVMRMLAGPRPTFRNLEPYFTDRRVAAAGRSLAALPRYIVGPDQIAEMRDYWPGKLVVKGILDPRSARDMIAAGADGLVVSNHGGRQLDAAPSPVAALPAIRAAVGPDVPLLADSGATSGLDILRLLRLGADMVLIGRYPYAAVGGLGKWAAKPALDIVCAQIETVMMQLGVRKVSELKDIPVRAPQ